MPFREKIAVKVGKIDIETPRIKRFTLYPLEESRLPGFSGGAHITTMVEIGGKKWVRPYSLCSDPEERACYAIAIRLQEHSTGGSAVWHHHVQEGTELVISQPKNFFSLSSQAVHHVFIAGGIGITPFLPMMLDAKARGESFELHVAAPSQEACAFYGWIRSRFDKQSRFYFSQVGNRYTPEGLRDQRVGTHVYVCGPPSLVESVTQAARSYGYPRKSIHVERFSPPVTQSPRSFTVERKQSGQKLWVPAEHSLLETLLQAGVHVPYSCRMGRCGTCAISVLHGEVEHRDQYLTEEEKRAHRTILSCVSRSKGEMLVLDC